MFYFVWTFSGFRQSLTIAIGLYYLLRALEEKKMLKIIIVSSALSFIHSSSLILIVLFFLSRFDFRKKSLIILTIASILFSVLPLGFLFNYVPSSLIAVKVAPYIQSTLSFNFLDFQSISRIALLTLVFFYYDALVKITSFNKTILNVYIISILFYFIFQFTGELTAARLSIYGRVVEVILFANIY